MERGTREAPPQEYGPEQLKRDLEAHWDMDLMGFRHELEILDETDANTLETGAQRVRFEKDWKGREAAGDEIKNSAVGFIDRELKREEILRKIEATKRVIARLSGK